MKNLCLLSALLALGACSTETPLFEKTDPAQTGITFANQLQETEGENVLAFEYFYNGGGVAAGDLNNDGRVDLVFTGNQVGNKLYLNQTEPGSNQLAFSDVTDKARIAGRPGGWKTGVTLADVNADGWLDIYVCYSGPRPEAERPNQLFINNHDLTFTEQAAQYGLDDRGYSVQATFFDYDRDGDLDCFLINHNLSNYQRQEAAVMRNKRDANAGDKLFRNDGSRFVDVSEQAGIRGNPLGFGLSCAVSDLNNDGWPDIYVTNDFVEDDYCYINQGATGSNGPTFRDELRDRIAHTSYSSMGADVADLNNDNRPDLMTLDMMPESNERQKTLPWPDNWNVYQAQLRNGFWHQNMRNMLQIQQPNGTFAELGQLAGVAATDWSWGVLLADYDLDGLKDIFVTNGVLRDFTDADFVKFSDDAEGKSMPVLEQIKQMPSTRSKNYIFRNNGDLTFSNQQQAWGFDEPTVSNGCAYADLDNDGDLDLITNNINEPARVYRNQARERTQNHYLSIRLQGPPQNPFGIGARLSVERAGQTQVQEYFPTRGFESCSHDKLLFGLSNSGEPVRVTVRWPDGRSQTLPAVKPDQTLTLSYTKAATAPQPTPPTQATLFTAGPAVPFTHRPDSINAFDRQVLLPMQYSANGPRIATGDIDGDGQPDVFVCGNARQPGQLFRQSGGSFKPVAISGLASPGLEGNTNQDALLADLNGDGTLDLYVVNGGYAVREPERRQDKLWLNQRGQFVPAPLPAETANSSCVKALDLDRDGDLDLVVGGSIQPYRFPLSDETFLLINDGKARFRKQSLGDLGLVSDIAVTDLDRNGWPDLVVVGEWMPVTTLLNQRGTFDPKTAKRYDDLAGWWNRLEKADLDGDGDDDLIVGNLGLNTPIRASSEQPATLVYNDFDANGTIDFVMNYAVGNGVYPAYSRDELCEQLPVLRRKFTSYKLYAGATLADCFDPEQLKQSGQKQLTTVQTLVLENNNGKLVPHALPILAQSAPVYGIVAHDFDRNGKTDLLLVGNNSQFRLRIGKVDANRGLVLANRGNWQFAELPSTQTDLFVQGDVRDAKQAGNQLFISTHGKGITVLNKGQ